MGQALRVDADLLRALTPELAAIADAAEQELARLKERLAGEGECWGNDEPGRVFGESYEPAAREGITGFENLVHNLHGMSKGVADAGETFQNQDQQIGSGLRDRGQLFADPGPLAPISPSPYQPEGQIPQTARSGSQPSGFEPDAAHNAPAPAPSNASDVPSLPEQPGYQPGSNPASTVQPSSSSYGPGAPEPLGQQPAPGSTVAPPVRAPAAPSVPTPAPSPAQSSAAAPPAAAPKIGAPAPAADRRPPDARASRPVADTPWLRNTPGTPWSRNPTGSPAPGQVFPPRRTTPEPGAAKPAKRGKDAEPRRAKVESARPKRARVRTDPAAVAAATALAGRHGMRIAGFDTSGIDKATVDEIATAVDDILGKYPFLELGGIEIAELRDGTVSRVVWGRTPEEGQEQVTGAWILLDAVAAANPALLAEKIRAATRSGERVAGSEQRPMYSTIVHDLGRILEASAGPRVRRLAQRFLITEYRRISGPWNCGETFAAIVRGYREWRAQLSPASFAGERLDPRAAVVQAFTEVELHGDSACGPATVLHRLVVEHLRGRLSA